MRMVHILTKSVESYSHFAQLTSCSNRIAADRSSGCSNSVEGIGIWCWFVDRRISRSTTSTFTIRTGSRSFKQLINQCFVARPHAPQMQLLLTGRSFWHRLPFFTHWGRPVWYAAKVQLLMCFLQSETWIQSSNQKYWETCRKMYAGDVQIVRTEAHNQHTTSKHTFARKSISSGCNTMHTMMIAACSHTFIILVCLRHARCSHFVNSCWSSSGRNL